ncbi:UDP-D-apiose/UDP-D-xylose synthase 1 [Perilla frutescens var. frutescens]|nr:UDP-D-apiose/UDP-D-xylose synthase 1 [Perilla frutescens var. frutescens]
MIRMIGAGGFINSHLCEKLLEKTPHRLMVVDTTDVEKPTTDDSFVPASSSLAVNPVSTSVRPPSPQKSSVFSGNHSVNQAVGLKLFACSFSFVAGAAVDLSPSHGSLALLESTGIISTLFRDAATNSRSSLTNSHKLLCRRCLSLHVLNLEFSATMKPSSYSLQVGAA